MNVLYNSSAFYVVEYPEYRGYEIIDKEAEVGGYIDGAVGATFIAQLSKIADVASPSADAIDSFLCRYSWCLLLPQCYH